MFHKRIKKRQALKKEYASPGYQTKIKRARQGQAARMEKKGYTTMTTPSGQQSGKKPTGPRPERKGGGGQAENTLYRYSVYQKKDKPPRKRGGSYSNVRFMT